MADCRITCIKKLDRSSLYEHITHVGNQPTWIWTREAVIRSIQSGTNTFFIINGGKRSEVGVVYPNDGRAPYLRTYADGQWNDNLLALPECLGE